MCKYIIYVFACVLFFFFAMQRYDACKFFMIQFNKQMLQIVKNVSKCCKIAKMMLHFSKKHMFFRQKCT